MGISGFRNFLKNEEILNSCWNMIYFSRNFWDIPRSTRVKGSLNGRVGMQEANTEGVLACVDSLKIGPI